MGRQKNRLAYLAVALLLMLLPSSVAAAVSGTPASTGTTTASPEAAPTFRVYAHREGLVGQTTANGHVIQENDRFVALPCFCALSSKDGHEFQVKITYQGRSVVAPVWDVGPWNVNDNYWDPPAERTWTGIPQGVPEAAAAYYNNYNGGLDGKGRKVRSPAGIDIADGTFWQDLGMTDSDWVEVTFLWMGEQAPAAVTLPPLPAGYEDIPTIPFGRRPPLDPVQPRSGWMYGPETKHNVAPPLADYWFAHGGWRTIGLPISEVFREVTADGNARIVQYFERQILELHVDDGGAASVTSALIGYAAAAPAAARAPVTPFADGADHRYFPETGHALSNGFKAHWEQHGGLEAFGYPLTEEFLAVTPDGRPYVAQVFERARFEWWPDKVGTDEDITYGLLVVELLRQAGWVP